MTPLKQHSSALPACRWLALARSPGGLFRGLPGDDSKPAFIFALIFFVLAAGIVVAGYFYYRHFERQFLVEARQQLSAIAELKVGELAQWRKERMADGGILFKNASFSALVRRFLEKPEDPDAQKQVRSWIDKYKAHFRYGEIRLLDTQGVTRISSPARLPATSSAVAEHASEARRSGQVAIQDFHRSEGDQKIRLAVMVPILDEADGNRPLGVLVLQIEPEEYLYPFIVRWPVPSETAETLLLRRDGNDVLYLNELRHQTNTAFALRLPLTRTEVPAVRVALGQTGIMTGVDYRGVPVLAAALAVPDSPWFIIAKRDLTEINAPLRERLWQIVVLTGILLIGAGAGVGLLWRQQRERFYRERAKSAEALRESEEKLRTLVTNLSSGVVVHAPDTSVIFSNPMASTLLGLTKDQMRGKQAIDPAWSFLRENGMALPLAEHPVNRVMSSGAPILNQVLGIHRPDLAEPVWVQCSAYPDTAVDGTLLQVVVTFSDITERKRANETLLQSRRAALNLMTDAVAARDRSEQMSKEQALNFQRTKTMLQLNQMTDATLQEITDFALEEVVRMTQSTIGYLAFLNEDESVLTMHAWSKSAMAECAIIDKPIIYPVVTTGLWGEAVRQRRPVFTNDYAAANPLKKGYPQGHVAVKRHMNVPVFDGTRIVIVAGVGNKNEEYNESDAEQLLLLMDGMWRLIERKRAEEALQESETQLSTILKNDPTGIFIVNEKTRIIYDVNDTALEVIGLPKGDVVGKVCHRFLCPAEMGCCPICDLGQTVDRSERVLLKPDGTRVPILKSVVPIKLKGENYFLESFIDITERKRAEEAVKQSEEKFRNLFDNAMEGVYQSTPEGRLISANMAFARMFGYESPEEFINTVTDLASQLYVNQDDRKIAVGIFKEKGYIKDFECQMRRKDGSIFWARYDGRFTKTQDGATCFQGFIIDITDRKEAEEAIQGLNAELEQRVIARTTQLEATNKELEAFSYSVSHDLRAPLRSIDGFSKALLEEYQEKLDDTGKSFLERVRKATQRMGLLIDDMLKLSRITQAEMKRGAVDLSGMVREITVSHQKDNSDRAVDVTVQEEIVVQGDPYLLKIAMENLVGNAFKFTGKKAHPRIEFGAVNKDGETCYFIRDNGAGFDMAYVNKLFGAFQRLHASDEFPGTGIGLATVQRIIHRHGGRVWAEGEIGKGATFYITLPS